MSVLTRVEFVPDSTFSSAVTQKLPHLHRGAHNGDGAGLAAQFGSGAGTHLNWRHAEPDVDHGRAAGGEGGAGYLFRAREPAVAGQPAA